MSCHDLLITLHIFGFLSLYIGHNAGISRLGDGKICVILLSSHGNSSLSSHGNSKSRMLKKKFGRRKKKSQNFIFYYYLSCHVLSWFADHASHFWFSQPLHRTGAEISMSWWNFQKKPEFSEFLVSASSILINCGGRIIKSWNCMAN